MNQAHQSQKSQGSLGGGYGQFGWQILKMSPELRSMVLCNLNLSAHAHNKMSRNKPVFLLSLCKLRFFCQCLEVEACCEFDVPGGDGLESC